MTFKYVASKKPKEQYLPKPVMAAEPQPYYSGLVMGSRASHGEENLYNALMATKRIAHLWFRFAVGAPIHYPGQKELDFLILTVAGIYIAIQVRDFDYIHAGEENRAKDFASDMFILEALRKDGVTVMNNEVITVDDDLLETPEEAAIYAKRILI